MDVEPKMIGRVTRCSTRGFVGALRLPEPEVPVFGTFCMAEAQQGQSRVVGLIYDISIADDELARQLAAVEDPPPEQLADSQYSRQVPVEFSALAVGFADDQHFHHGLPPQPPLTLAPIRMMTPQEVSDFTGDLGFIHIVLSASEIPADDLLIAALRHAARARPEQEQRPFLLKAGRTSARLLAKDLARLDRLVAELKA